MTNREFFATRWEAEGKAFVNVLKALPESKAGYRPDPRSRSAAELAWVLAGNANGLIALIDNGELDLKDTPPPGKLEDIANRFATAHRAVTSRIRQLDSATWRKKAKLKMGGKVVWESQLGEMVWGFFLDSIHHRGQLSTYIRPMGGKVPSIYGPSGDDPGRM